MTENSYFEETATHRIIRLPKRVFGDEHPEIPEGATDYERQELNRHWRDAISASLAITKLAAEVHETVMVEGTTRATEGQGLSRFVADLHIAVASMAAVENGIHHRLAVEKRARAEVEG